MLNNALLRLFGGGGELNGKDTHKEIFPFFGRKCFSSKQFTTGMGNPLNDVRKSQIMPDQVRKWLRQQSELFYAAGFAALVKRRDKCINIGGGFAEK
jgi:hypothetical protein